MWVIDTNSVLELHRVYNPLYFRPLWDDVDRLIERGLLVSTRVNFDELEDRSGEESLREWKIAHKHIFREPDEAEQRAVGEVLANFPDLIDVNSDADQADPYLVAMAMKLKATVITEERLLDPSAVRNPNRKEKMRIPNVCAHYGIPCIRVVPFINSPAWRVVLSEAP